MKFAPVSIFLALGHVRSVIGVGREYDYDDAEEEDPPPKYDRKDEVRDAEAYLNKVFSPKETWKDARADYMLYVNGSHWGMNWKSPKAFKMYPGDKKARPCFAQGHPLGLSQHGNEQYSAFEAKKTKRGWPGRFKACTEPSGTCAEQCCSGKLTTSKLYNRRPEICDCIAKGQPIVDGAGSQCCSMRAEKKGSDYVCAGIPPLVSNQPLIILKNSLIKLDLKNCMYPPVQLLPEGDTDRTRAHYRETLRTEMCGPRQCQKPGATPAGQKLICCGDPKPWDRPEDPKDQPCGCSLPDAKHDNRINALASDCCSGSYKTPESDKVCSCLPGNSLVPPNAPASACCSGKTIKRFDKTWCMADECTPQGQTIAKDKAVDGKQGQHCCAHLTTGIVYDITKACGCVWGGMRPVDNNPSRCCSQSVETDGTCSWIPVPGTIDAWMNETECFSGDADENNKCKCMPPLSKVRSKAAIAAHPDQCCSKHIISDGPNAGLCSCITTGKRLGYGSDESHCCSGKAKNGVCICAKPGAAYRKDHGMTSHDCCSSNAGEHFCHCSATGSSAAHRACCGKVSDDKTCECIPDGHLVPASDMENPASVCCNKPKEACGRQCGV